MSRFIAASDSVLNDLNQTSVYPASDCTDNTSSSSTSQGSNTLYLKGRQGQDLGSLTEDQDCTNLGEAEGFSHEDVLEDIEEGTSSVLSSSLSDISNECLAFRAPWATPPTATFEGKHRATRNQGFPNQLQPNFVTSPPLSVQSPESSEFVVTDLGDSFPADQTFSGGETTRTSTIAIKFCI